MSEAEVAALRTAADQGAKALQKIEASEREAIAAKMIFSSSNSEGRFLPKQKPAVDGFSQDAFRDAARIVRRRSSTHAEG